MQIKTLNTLFKLYKTPSLFGRYIWLDNLSPLLNDLSVKGIAIDVAGHSVLNAPIHKITIGKGSKRILLWSQMHGNESTTTKAIFDLLNFLNSNNEVAKTILNACQLVIIPMLNPDGAELYTRLNANKIDLNRDAQDLSQPESKVLRAVFDSFKPQWCFNLHGQRTIFSAGASSNVATVSFLTPAADASRAVNPSRTLSMEVISEMNTMLQKEIPNQVGIYDDSFNANCVGDLFQSLGVPTILFEAGHYKNDYNREEVRRFIFQSYIVALNYIATTTIKGHKHENYFLIPENDKLYFDIIIRNAKLNSKLTDIAIQYEEKLIDSRINFIPRVMKIEKLEKFYAHKVIDAKNRSVYKENKLHLSIDDELYFVAIDNNRINVKINQD